jgi:hypothetical protein
VGRSNHYRYASDNGVNYYRRSTFTDDDDEGYVNDTEDEHMRIEFKESIAKARAEIRKGMEFLELITVRPCRRFTAMSSSSSQCLSSSSFLA